MYLKKYVALKPGDAEAQKDLGDMLYESKNSAGALSAYRAALVADPAIKGIYKHYVELVMAKGTPEELVSICRAFGMDDKEMEEVFDDKAKDEE